MEQPVKKLKLEEDPFVVLLEELHQNILQHFTGKDILKLFEVSTSWNHRMLASPVAMDKIQLNVSGRWLPQADIIILLKSERKYRNLVAYFYDESNFDRMLLILQRFSSTIVYLSSCMDTLLWFDEVLPDLKFPHLSSLHLGYLPVDLSLSLINESPKLEQIHIGYLDLETEVIEAIEDKTSLKKLTMNASQSWFTGLEMQNAKFKLTYFELLNIFDHDREEDFSEFLFQFSDTLTSLSLYNFLAKESHTILSQLRKLKKFKFTFLIHEDDDDDDNFQFPTNKTITNIGFSLFNLCSWTERFLKSCQELENMQVYFFGDANYKWIIRNKHNWKNLKTVNNIEVSQLVKQ